MIKFPENFRKVTGISKLLALSLFILLPFVGFIYGVKFYKSLADIIISDLNSKVKLNDKCEVQYNKVITPAYNSKSECWKNNNWREIEGCTELRRKLIISLATIEEAKNKIYLVQNSVEANYQNKYVSTEYNFSFNYPDSWKIKEFDYEGIKTVNLYMSEQNGEIIEVTIGTGMVYSTSGALCANKGCDYEGGEITLLNGKKITLTKSYKFITTEADEFIPLDTEVENYRFSSDLSNFIEGYSNDKFIYVTGSFSDEASGQLILDILSTLQYEPSQ